MISYHRRTNPGPASANKQASQVGYRSQHSLDAENARCGDCPSILRTGKVTAKCEWYGDTLAFRKLGKKHGFVVGFRRCAECMAEGKHHDLDDAIEGYQ